MEAHVVLTIDIEIVCERITGCDFVSEIDERVGYMGEIIPFLNRRTMIERN